MRLPTCTQVQLHSSASTTPRADALYCKLKQVHSSYATRHDSVSRRQCSIRSGDKNEVSRRLRSTINLEEVKAFFPRRVEERPSVQWTKVNSASTTPTRSHRPLVSPDAGDALPASMGMHAAAATTVCENDVFTNKTIPQFSAMTILLQELQVELLSSTGRTGYIPPHLRRPTSASPASNANRFKPETSEFTTELSSERTGYVPPHLRHSISATAGLSGERTSYVPPHPRHSISSTSVLPSSRTFIPKTTTLKGSMKVNTSNTSTLLCDQDNHKLRYSDHKDYSKHHDKLPANDVSRQSHETEESSTKPQAMDTSRNLRPLLNLLRDARTAEEMTTTRSSPSRTLMSSHTAAASADRNHDTTEALRATTRAYDQPTSEPVLPATSEKPSKIASDIRPLRDPDKFLTSLEQFCCRKATQPSRNLQPVDLRPSILSAEPSYSQQVGCSVNLTRDNSALAPISLQCEVISCITSSYRVRWAGISTPTGTRQCILDLAARTIPTHKVHWQTSSSFYELNSRIAEELTSLQVNSHHVSRLRDQEALRKPRTNRTFSSSESQLPRAGANSHYPPAYGTAGPRTESEPQDSRVLANSRLASYPSDRLHQTACREATVGRPHSLNGHGPVKMSKYLVADHIGDIAPMTSALMH